MTPETSKETEGGSAPDRLDERAKSIVRARMWNMSLFVCVFFFFSSRRRHTRLQGDWSSDVCSSDLEPCRCGRGECLSGEHGRLQPLQRGLQRVLRLPGSGAHHRGGGAAAAPAAADRDQGGRLSPGGRDG